MLRSLGFWFLLTSCGSSGDTGDNPAAAEALDGSTEASADTGPPAADGRECRVESREAPFVFDAAGTVIALDRCRYRIDGRILTLGLFAKESNALLRAPDKSAIVIEWELTELFLDVTYFFNVNSNDPAAYPRAYAQLPDGTKCLFGADASLGLARANVLSGVSPDPRFDVVGYPDGGVGLRTEDLSFELQVSAGLCTPPRLEEGNTSRGTVSGRFRATAGRFKRE